MTPTEKDAMALAGLAHVAENMVPLATKVDVQVRLERAERFASNIRTHSAHLASRIAELEGELEVQREQNRLGAARELEFLDRATRAEAELAAVRANAERYLHLREANNADPTPFIAQRYEHGIMQWTGEEADAAIDAARGGE